jgi:hypothetical protein
MTPEEQAVINAAIELRRRIPGRDQREVLALSNATWKLITSCEECNTDTHRCPGCGAPVPHAGTGVCPGCAGEVNTPPPWAPPMEWVLRTWKDVRTSDRVRMPGTDVTAVIECRYLHSSQDPQGRTWHVVSGGSGQRARFDDHVVLPHECVVLLAGEKDVRFMDPAKPVEIEMAAEEVNVRNLLGWENRL